LTSSTPSLLTADDVAQQLSVPTSWVYKQVSARKIPFVKIGRYVRFEPAAIEQWLQEHCRA
jgi:excisionase family DNA binding protein